MTNADRTSERVHLAGVETQLTNIGNSDCAESLIQLPMRNFRLVKASFAEQLQTKNMTGKDGYRSNWYE